MNKIFIFIIPTLLFIIQALLRLIPADAKSVQSLIAKCNDFNFQIQIYAAFILIILFFLNHFFSITKPFKRLQKFDTVKFDIIEKDVVKFIEEYKEMQIDLRVNIMQIKRKFFGFHKCKKYWIPFIGVKYFKFIYTYNMDHDIDKKLKLSLQQGACSQVFDEGVILTDLTVENVFSFNLRENQKKLAKDIKFILSAPIWQLDYDTKKLTDKIIGVINIDSKKISFKQIEEVELFGDLVDKIKNLSTIVSYLI